MQQSGAAIASVLSEIAVTTVLVWHARCSYQLAIGRNYVISLGAALAAMTAVVCWLKHLSWAVPVMLFVLIAAAAAVLFRNDTVMELLHKGLERLQKHGKGRNI